MSLRIQLVEEENEKLKINNYSIPKKKSETLEYISFSKIISSYGVIVLHINGFWKFRSNNIRQFRILNLYESVFYFSVPVFVLCIGATLLNFNEKYSLIEYNKRRFFKVIIPLLGWNIILYYYKAYYLKSIKKEKFSFVNLWNYFFLSKVNHIFDSLHLFLLSYMIIPLIAYVEKSNKMKIYIYYFFFLLITQAIIPYIFKVFDFRLVWIYKLKLGYTIYVLAGYIINNYKFALYQKKIVYSLGFFSFLIHFFGTEYCYFINRKNIRLHKGYLNVPSIIYSCSLFLLIKEKSYIIYKRYKNIINKIGSLTFGPFFLHNPLNDIFLSYPILYKYISYNTFLHGLCIFLISLIISKILKQIPILKLLVP